MKEGIRDLARTMGIEADLDIIADNIFGDTPITEDEREMLEFGLCIGFCCGARGVPLRKFMASGDCVERPTRNAASRAD